jgi:hypothetical protein
MAHCHTNVRTGASVSISAQNPLRTAATALLAVALMGGASAASAHALEEPVVPAVSEVQDATQPLVQRLAHLPPASDLPSGVVQISPHVPGMGEHWADPRDLPLGPIYCVMEGRVTCMEFMIAQQDLQSGRSFEQLQPWVLDGVPQPSVDHMNLDFMPQGHPGFDVPHYDVHMYFVPPEFLEQDSAARQAAH